MKRRDLLKRFFAKGWKIDHEGGEHTVLVRGSQYETVPRHRELNEGLARALIRKHEL